MQTSPRHAIVIIALGALSACSASDRLLIGEILDNANQGDGDGSSMTPPPGTAEPSMPPPTGMSEPPIASSDPGDMQGQLAQGILDESCASCHNPMRALGLISSTDIDDLIAVGLIVPGDSAASAVVQRMLRREMPPISFPQPSDTEIQFVAEFVDSL